MRIMVFYGFLEPQLCDKSWELLHNISNNVNEDRIVGGGFNDILEENEKWGGRKKAQTTLENFRKVVEDLALTDVKPDKG